MKKLSILIFALLATIFSAQKLDNIQSGETLNYRIHYGFINGGTATLNTQKTTYQGEPHFYVKGVGRSSGAVSAFFPVMDIYESFINYNTGLPSFYVRNVHEGSYTQHYETAFNQKNQTLVLTDKKNKEKGSRVIKSVKGIQDMLSAFYYLRSFDKNEIRPGNVYNLNVWIDDQMFPFQLKVAGAENISTKFGKVNCLKIIPSVMSGRVFKAKEGVILWVTNDANHIPIAIKAELAVGSLKADLDSYKNVKFPIDFK